MTLDSRERAVRVISRYCHAENLSFILSPSEVPRVKPEPDALLALAERFSVPANRIVMVGDMYVDLQMARRAGAFSVGIPESESTRSRMPPITNRPSTVNSDRILSMIPLSVSCLTAFVPML